MNNSIFAEEEQELDFIGRIFDIKRFATGDGPGIRTLVFLKGCPLRCQWCANPESQKSKSEIMYYKNLCKGCGKCLTSCPVSAIKHDEKFGLITDASKCILCGNCVHSCFYSAREIVGKDMTVSEVMEIVVKDKSHYDNSGGGVTLTGGEPLFQPLFTKMLLKACKDFGIKTAIETTGFTKWCNIEEILPFLDLIFYDFKHIDADMHCQYTGVDNEIILENLSMLNNTFDHKDIIVRIPFIRGFNSSDETQERMYRFISKFRNIKRIEIMPYHRLGNTKYYGLGRGYNLEDLEPVHKKDLEYLKELGNKCNVKVHIGSI